MRDSSKMLMFLSAKKFESNKVVRGAFLLSDEETRPLEFRCTNPIRPTQLQTVLYGDTLEEYILVELIGQPLVKGASDSPDLVLVNESAFLKLRTRIDVPVVLITKEERIDVEQDSQTVFSMLNSTSGKFDPIVISVHPDFGGDKDLARSFLAGIFNHHDLVEPFNRISTALEQVHASKVGEGQTA